MDDPLLSNMAKKKQEQMKVVAPKRERFVLTCHGERGIPLGVGLRITSHLFLHLATDSSSVPIQLYR